MELAIPIAGAGLGYMAVGTATAVQFGWFAGSLLYSYLGQENIEGPKLQDLSYSGSSYGTPIPRVWGTCGVAGTYIYAPDLTEHESESGKGGPSVTLSTYTADFAVLFCEGPVSAIRRLWFNSELVYDASDNNEGIAVKKGLNLTIYLGDQTQLPDPMMEANEGAGNVSAHRGYCYIVVNDMAVEDFGNSWPKAVRAEIVKDDTIVNPNLDLGVIANNATSAWSVSDDTFVTYGDNQIFYRINPNTNAVISTSAAVTSHGGGPTWDIHPISGKVYTWDWTPPAPLTYYHIAEIDPTTGAYIQGSSWDAIGCFPSATATGVNEIIVLNNGNIAACNGGAGDTNITIWTDTLSCDDARVTSTSASVVWAMDDSSFNLWYLMPSTNIVNISLDGIGSDYDLNSLFGLTGINRMQWHVPTQSMLVSDSANTWRISYLLGSVSLETASPASGVLFRSDAKRWSVADTIWLQNGSLTFRQVWVDDMTSIRTETYSTIGGSLVYDALSNAIWHGQAAGENQHKLLLDRVPISPQTLQTVVSEIADGLVADEKDVTGLSGNVRGFIMSRPESSRAAIRRLMAAHRFGAVESGAKVKFAMMGGSLMATIPEDDLAAHAMGTDTPSQTVIKRTQEIIFPRRVEVSALSIEREYEPSVQGAGRQLTPATGIQKIQLVEVLTDDEIAQLAEISLHTPRVERNSHEFQVGNEYLYLEPTDEVVITKGADTHRVRIGQCDWGSPGIIKMSAVSVDVAALSSSAVGSEGGFLPSAINDKRVTNPFLMDIALLNNQDDHPGFYFGGQSDAGTWGGATLFRAVSNTGANPEELLSVVNEAQTGFSTAALADTSKTETWDYVNTLTLRPTEGTLSSATEAAVLAGANTLALLTTGEIIQFVTSVDNGDGTYTISQLLRGRRGTEHATDGHVTSEVFVMLATLPIYDVQTTIATSGVLHYYRAVTFGLSLLDSVPHRFTNTNVRLKPWSPVHLGATESAGDVTLTWIRRTRLFVEPEYKNIPLGETTEAYEVDILDISGTVLRTITATSETITYTNAQQVADFGAAPSGFDFKIYQMSSAIGRGYPACSSTSALGLLLSVYTDFSEYTVSTQPNDWTNNFPRASTSPENTPFTTYLIESPATSPEAVGGKAARVTNVVNGGYGGWNWDKAGVEANVEILVRGTFATVGSGVHLRLTGSYTENSNNDQEFYYAEINSAKKGTITHVKFTTTIHTATAIQGTLMGALTINNGDPYWIRFFANNDSLKAQFSTTDLDGVTPTWDYEITDTEQSSAGTAGIISYLNGLAGGVHDYDQFAVAYNGNRATFT